MPHQKRFCLLYLWLNVSPFPWVLFSVSALSVSSDFKAYVLLESSFSEILSFTSFISVSSITLLFLLSSVSTPGFSKATSSDSLLSGVSLLLFFFRDPPLVTVPLVFRLLFSFPFEVDLTELISCSSSLLKCFDLPSTESSSMIRFFVSVLSFATCWKLCLKILKRCFWTWHIMNSVINQAKIVGITHATSAVLLVIRAFHISVIPQNVLLLLYIGKFTQ